MSALWVLAPVALVGACVVAARWGRVGVAMEDLFRTLDPTPPEITVRLTDEECDALFDEVTAWMARQYLAGGGES